MSLRFFTANRLEALAERLAEVLRAPLPSPLMEEIIVVQSRGMERWVSMQLAGYHGICANYRFPFPNTFLHGLFRKLLPDVSERSAFDPEFLTWRILKLIPSLLTRPGFEGLRAYAGDSDRGLRLLQLALRIADTFDQYLLFRPEMIFRWEEGEEGHWQAGLWRELVKGQDKTHRAALGKAFLRAVQEGDVDPNLFPQRVSFFGISMLPRFHLEMLGAISRWTSVNLFLMNPCKEYWGDILSEREMERVRVRSAGGSPPPSELHLERGNSLLASLGILGRDFFEMVYELEPEETDLYTEPGEESLLACIQSDILNMRERGGHSGLRSPVQQHDESLQIHSCHSPMREVEVLRDSLLHMFEKDPHLLPGEILVMTPDIEIYAPYIQAVFDLPPDDPTRIPFTIADRSVKGESSVIRAFLAILDLSGSRFGVSQVFSFLDCDAVRKKFDLTLGDVEKIRNWIAETGIRWGLDGENRLRFGLPPFQENTWKAGLQRLLMGYALPGAGEHLFEGILPYDHMEGSDAETLGRFLEFAKRLFHSAELIAGRRTLEGWAGVLGGILGDLFLEEEETEGEFQVIRNALHALRTLAPAGGGAFDEEVEFGLIKWYLGRMAEREGFGRGFLTGGVTFCALLPMRSVPFKVICLMGMNADSYPRQSQPLGFDLMARHPKRGDRSRRNDDRHLFLEALISAREGFYISFVGQSLRDNTLIPPSVVVSELTDYVAQGFQIEGEEILERLVTSHRLQAFSPEYFRGKRGRLFSYSREHFDAASRLVQGPETPRSFISKGLSGPDADWKKVDVGDLVRFFEHPSRFLLQRRLGVSLEEKASLLEEREPFSMDRLEEYLLGQELLAGRLEGRDIRSMQALVRASGRLPHGAVGECLYEGMIAGLERFAQRLAPILGGSQAEPLEVEMEIDGFTLTGKIPGLYRGRLVLYRFAPIRARDLLRIWIYHLLLSALGAGGRRETSILAGLDPEKEDEAWLSLEFPLFERAGERLGSLLRVFQQGLTMPIRFFPRSSYTYAREVVERGRDHEGALVKARDVWMGNDYVQGERQDAYYELCFRDSDPVDPEFAETAIEVFEPLLKQINKDETI